MKVSALFIHAEPTGSVPVAGLSVLERSMVAAHRAGCHPIRVLVRSSLPRFRRLDAMGIAWERLESDSVPAFAGATLVAFSDVLISVADAQLLLESGGALETPGGTRLPVGILGPGAEPVGAAFDRLPAVRGGPVCARITDPAGGRAAERALWRSLKSSSDGWVDRHFNRPVGRVLSKVLIHTPISPNQVSLASILIGMASGWWFARGETWAAIVGAWVLQFSAIVDCVDGDLARVLYKESRLGRWLDLVGDQFVHVSVFAGIPVGLYRQGLAAPWFWLGFSCVVGVVLAFAAVVRGLTRTGQRRSERLVRWIDAATNRDFSVLLLVLAPFDALEWFVWAAAIGIHAFWVAVLALQVRESIATGKPGSTPP